MEGHRAGFGSDRGVNILLSRAAADALREEVARALEGVPYRLCTPEDGVDADIAFVSRDVTGLSTKHDILPATQRFYDALARSQRLRWVHVHSAGADRDIYVQLRERGVQLTTSSGANALIVAQTALAGVLALARHFPRLWQAQRERRWASLMGDTLPRDLEGQHAVVVGWGPIGQELARLLQAVGLRVTIVRHQDKPAGGLATVTTARWQDVLPSADWLLLACPLNAGTRGLVDAAALARLPAHAHFVNVARGEIVDEPALIAALQQGRLAGAYLDVFTHEPLPADSPLWTMPHVIVTPHSAGPSAGNPARQARMFLDNLRRWRAGEPLRNLASD